MNTQYNDIDQYIIECMLNGKNYSGKKVNSLKKKLGVDHKPLEILYSKSKGETIPFCEICNENQVKLISLSKGFRKFCSKKCYQISMSDRNSKNNETLNKKKAKKINEKYSKIVEQAKNEYLSSSARICDLETKYDIPKGRLRRYLSNNGLIDCDRRNNSLRKNLYLKLELSHNYLEDTKWVYEKISEGWTSKSFAEKLNCSPNFVCVKLRNQGIYLSDYNSAKSSYEQKLSNLLSDLNVRHIRNDRVILEGKEIDLFLPDHDLAIEVNGVYWHQDYNGEKKNYHLEKTIKCEKNQIKLLHITDKEIDEKYPLVKNLICSNVGINDKIYARKCKVKKINSKIFKEFLNENHFQGIINSSIKYGLFFENKLVSVMGFSKSRYNKNYQYELTRFCNKIGYNIVGGASKLYRCFIKDHQPKSIISYCDRRLFNGSLYEKLQMNFSHATPPNYIWVNNSGTCLSRYQTQKHLLEDCRKDQTENEYMKERGFMKIYDSGQKVYTSNFNATG